MSTTACTLGAWNKLFMLCLDPINKYSVLTRFSDNLFAERHCLIFARSWLMATSASRTDSPEAVNVVSSANILADENPKLPGKSFM